MEEIDLSFILDDPMPPSIKEDDYDSERDILILEEFLSNDSLSLPENESFHFDIPSSSRPPAKPPDGNSGILNVKVMGDISEHNVPMPRLMLTFIPNHEKSPNLLSHQGHKAFQPSTECSMMIYGRNTPILDINSLLDEFASELTFLKLIPPGINETNCDPEEETRNIKRLLYDKSSLRPPEEFISENSDTRGGFKDTYPDEILAPVLKMKLEISSSDMSWDPAPEDQRNTEWLLFMLSFLPHLLNPVLPIGVTSENVSQRFGVTRKEQDQAAEEGLRLILQLQCNVINDQP
nr:hypothetical protein [Tanacetum cinerariifolium]